MQRERSDTPLTQKNRDSTLFLMGHNSVRPFSTKDVSLIKTSDDIVDSKLSKSKNFNQSMVVAEPLQRPSRSSFIEQERLQNPGQDRLRKQSPRANSPKRTEPGETRRQRKIGAHDEQLALKLKADGVLNSELNLFKRTVNVDFIRVQSQRNLKYQTENPGASSTELELPKANGLSSAGVVRNPTFRMNDRKARSRSSTSEVDTSAAATTVTVLTDSKTQTDDDLERRRHRHKHHTRRTRSSAADKPKEVKAPSVAEEYEVPPAGRFAASSRKKGEKTFEELWMEGWREAHEKKKSYADTPERDSLDGQFPSSVGGGVSHELEPKSDPVKKKEDKKDKKGKKKKEKEEMALDMPPLPLPGLSTKKVPAMIGGDGWGGPREPCDRLWVALSSFYGKVLVVLTFAFCLTEVMDNKIEPLHFQGIYLVYLYVGSIVSILTIYVAILVDSCPGSSKASMASLTKSDPEVGSVRSLGSFRMTYFNKQTTPRTSFYLRIGALVFGLGTLVFSGLEIAMHSTMNSKCIAGDLAFAHPVLQALFTFLQMHFLFVNSEVLLQKFGILARFGLMHLVATNVSLWVRTIVWESANEWFHFLYHQHRYGHPGGNLIGAITAKIRGFVPNLPEDYYDYEDSLDSKNGASSLNLQDATSKASLTECSSYNPISEAHVRQMVSLYECFNNNTLGRSWTASMPYLFPFLVEYKLKIELHFGLIAAVAMYVIWRSIGAQPAEKLSTDGDSVSSGTLDPHRPGGKIRQKWRVDCQSSSIGLLVGLLCLVAAIIISIIFFVMKDNLDFRSEMFWICTGTQVAILSVCIVMNVIGFLQLPKLSPNNDELSLLDQILQNLTVGAILIFTVFGCIVGAQNITNPQNSMTLAMNMMIIIQVMMQHMFISELSVRACASRYQMAVKPGRQIVMFLLIVNVALWLLDSFLTHSWSTQEYQFTFYGILTWGVISRMTLPFLVFYRFHSAVVLVELWKNCYRTEDA